MVGMISPTTIENAPAAQQTPAPLPHLKIGNVDIGFPVVQAALSGYSDMAMRVIARRHGASYSLCEVVLDQVILQAGKKLKRRFLQVDPGEHPVAGQLMGSDPTEFAAAALELVAAGFDVVDINFGCPVKKVLGRCRGGFLLSTPETALEIVSRVRDAVPPHVPVSVKMRRGLDDTPESRDRFFTIFDGAFARGIAAATVHGRTVVQRYIGPSRWEFLTEVKRHAGSRTVLGSGDLFSPQACLDMIRTTGVDGVTVARGCIGNPWIFAQCRALAEGKPLPPPPSVFEQREIIREHYRLAEQIYGPNHFGRQMRKFGIKYSRLHPQALDVRNAFIAVTHTHELETVLQRWYSEDLPGRYPPDDPDESPAETTCEV
jgi:tRNA-dihydrouridine synthase B